MITIGKSHSPNHGDRRFPTTGGREKISLVILHYTDTVDAARSRQLMQDPAHQAAAHYLVDLDGQIEQLVDDGRRAWHAGNSFWGGERDINSLSLGIEIQSRGHRGGGQPYPSVQVDAVIALCRHLIATHGLDAEAVLGHSDVAPARKQDPGEWFPWQRLAGEGIGHWPDVTPDDMTAAVTPMADDATARLLAQCGYDPAADLPALLTAFQRHFVPEAFLSGASGDLTRARLIACARHAAGRKSGVLAL